jgi:hypothetical protein
MHAPRPGPLTSHRRSRSHRRLTQLHCGPSRRGSTLAATLWRAATGGYGETVTGCRATQSGTGETCALLQQPSSIVQCRRAAGHQVRQVRREVACAGTVVPTPVLFRPATQAGFSRTIYGLEPRVKLRRECWLKCCRKTCFTSVMERNNAWLRELIGRLSKARVLLVPHPPVVLKDSKRSG